MFGSTTAANLSAEVWRCTGPYIRRGQLAFRHCTLVGIAASR
jgi:hypothetical protein